MKKLVMSVAIVCAAVAAQASSVDWSFTETVKKANYGTQLDLTTYTAYLIDATTWDTFTGLDATAKTADAFAALTKADQAAITSISGDWSTTSTSKFGTGAQTKDVVSGYYYVVLADDNGFTASSKYEVTNWDHEASPTPSHKDALWSISATQAPLNASSFTSFATIPEPTSGLLLLLGVAGLALKRKCA